MIGREEQEVRGTVGLDVPRPEQRPGRGEDRGDAAPGQGLTFGLGGLRLPLAVLGLLVVLVAVMVVAVSIGAVNIPVADVWTVLLHHVTGQGATGDPALDQIVWMFRAPRVALAALVGAGLAVTGAVLQTLVSNPLADPIVLGFSYGASLGAVLVITLGGAALAGLGGLGVSGAAFIGALTAGLLAFALGQRRGRLAPTRLVLAGVIVGYVFLSLTSFIQLLATPTELRTVMFWMLGSVAGAQWDQLPTVAVVVLTSTVVLTLFGRRLNALLAGDESATALGVAVAVSML